MVELIETTLLESAPRIDKEAGILYGVKLLGEHSKNGRRYLPETMRKAAPLYEGVKSYVNHPEREKISEDRKIEDWTGVYRNAHYREGLGIFADEHLLKTSEHFDKIIDAALNFPREIGKSHVANGESRMDGGEEIIESITEVFHVDWVTDPATTAGIFESRRKAKPKTVKRTIESLPEGTQRTRLIEMMGEYGIGEMPMESDKPTDPFAQLAALCERLVQMLGEALIASKTPPPIAPPAPEAEVPEEQMTDDKTKPNANPAAPEGEDKKKSNPFESDQAKIAALEAKTMLLESGREVTPVRIKALAAAAEADRAELLESWSQLEAGERPARSPALIESEGFADFPRDNPEKFAAMLR